MKDATDVAVDSVLESKYYERGALDTVLSMATKSGDV